MGSEGSDGGRVVQNGEKKMSIQEDRRMGGGGTLRCVMLIVQRLT